MLKQIKHLEHASHFVSPQIIQELYFMLLNKFLGRKFVAPKPWVAALLFIQIIKRHNIPVINFCWPSAVTNSLATKLKALRETALF